MIPAKRIVMYASAVATVVWSVWFLKLRLDEPALTETQLMIKYWYLVLTAIGCALLFAVVSRLPDDES